LVFAWNCIFGILVGAGLAAARLAFNRIDGTFFLWCALAASVMLLLSYFLENLSCQGFWYDFATCVVAAFMASYAYDRVLLGNFWYSTEYDWALNWALKMAAVGGVPIGLIYAALNRRG
jgi:hypothetical protein